MEIKTGSGKPRQINIPPTVQAEIERLENRIPRVKQVLRGWCWRLARNPMVGFPVNVSLGPGPAHTPENLRVVRSAEGTSVPAVVITFAFDESELYVLAVRAFPPGKHVTL